MSSTIDPNIDSFDLNQLFDSAYHLSNLSSEKNNSSENTVSITMVKRLNDIQSTSNPNVVGSFVWQSNEANSMSGQLNVLGSTPNDECGCVQQGCLQKLKVLRLRHRRIMQKKYYRRNRQLELIKSMISTDLNQMEPSQENAETVPSLPIVLSATQRRFSKIKTRPCWRALHRNTYVLREEFDPEHYVTTCLCLIHDCKNALTSLKEYHERAINLKNQELIQGDKFIGQLETNEQSVENQ